CRTSSSSVTMGRPVRSRASSSSSSASVPSPRNAYGDVLGLYAPPRSIAPPAACTAAAVSRSIARPSTEHGPEITATLRSPTRTRPPISMVVVLRLHELRATNGCSDIVDLPGGKQKKAPESSREPGGAGVKSRLVCDARAPMAPGGPVAKKEVGGGVADWQGES